MSIESEVFSRIGTDDTMTQGDIQRLLARHPGRPCLAFAEDRLHPIHMLRRLPARWLARSEAEPFVSLASPGEYFAFQVGVYAAVGLKNVAVRCSDFFAADGSALPASGFTCFNLGGVDCQGRAFEKQLSIAQGHVQPLWLGVQIPLDSRGKRFDGFITVTPEGCEPVPVMVSIDVAGEPVEDSGDGEPWRHSRLRWLDSTIALDDELIAPFTPLAVKGSTVACLGRKVTLNALGLPERIESLFSPALNDFLPQGKQVLAAPARFVVETAEGATVLAGGTLRFTRELPGVVSWEAEATQSGLSLKVAADMEFDGYIGYRVTVEATKDVDVRDIRLELPYAGQAAKYLMGMGRKGGRRPELLDWKWDETLNQDTLWMGDVDAGLMVRLKGPDYEKPYMLIYYHYKPLKLPDAWHNGGRGGCTVREEGDGAVLFTAAGGPRSLKAGERLEFWFDLAVTPVKPLDTAEHWNYRYYHSVPENLAQVTAQGANVVNIHHGNRFNPFINSPFFETEALTSLVRHCHDSGVKLKIYYTIKELTVRMAEFWAIRSLGPEVLSRTDNVGPSWQGPRPFADEWMEKNLEEEFITAWRQKVDDGHYEDETDASVVVEPMSRFNNYYLEALRWLLEHTGMDGLYFDDVAFDRSIMKRIRKVLNRHKPGCMIDLHSWNYFSNNTLDDTRPAGWANSMNLYIDNMAFMDRLWFGEGFDYSEGPDYWLIETSGLPFGMMGEMLQDGGNPWRGMTYGMTTRLYAHSDPSGLWQLWDEFGIRDAVMLGYWNPDCPVKTSDGNVLATVYRRADKALISLASWAPEPVEVSLSIDLASLGMSAETAVLRAPAVAGLQEEKALTLDCRLPVQPGRGWLVLVERGK